MITVIGNTTITVTSGDDVTISVTIGSLNLPVIVQWSYNNQPLATNSDYTITTILSSDNTTGNSSLTVHTTNTGDGGNYTVNVSNIAGINMTTISVVIHGEFIINPKKIYISSNLNHFLVYSEKLQGYVSHNVLVKKTELET